jgi:hypothetical protein
MGVRALTTTRARMRRHEPRAALPLMVNNCRSATASSPPFAGDRI